MRPSGRRPDELRAVRITRGYTRHAEGSVLVECGDTKVLCTASVLERQPPHLQGTAAGLGHGGVRHAAALDQHAHATARRRAASSRAAPRRSSG